ncbi:hypothetical protein BCR33DRAFT_849671, partial [Rhizoclosmatium globosum]
MMHRSSADVPLRTTIKNSQQNSDIFNYSLPVSSPSTGKRFDRSNSSSNNNSSSTSNVFGGSAWKVEEGGVRRRGVDRMASDVFNVNYNLNSAAASATATATAAAAAEAETNNSAYNPSFLGGGGGDDDKPRRQTPPRESHSHSQRDHYDSNVHDDYDYYAQAAAHDAHEDYAAAIQPSLTPARATPFAHGRYVDNQDNHGQDTNNNSHFNQPQHSQLPPSSASAAGAASNAYRKSSSFDNIFSDSTAYHPSTIKRNNHHRHTNIFHDNDAPSSASASASRGKLTASEYSLPPAPVARSHGPSNNAIFPTSFGDNLHFSDAPAPRSGRRHFNVPSRSSIFDFNDESMGGGSGVQRSGSSASLTSRKPEYSTSSAANNHASLPRSSSSAYEPVSGIIPGLASSSPANGLSSYGDDGSRYNASNADSNRTGGLSSMDLNRERFGRGRRQAFEPSQIFF